MGGVLCKEDCDSFWEKVSSSPDDSRCPWHSDVETDWNGCRKFARIPPVGQHPRLFFSKEDIPRIVARFNHSEIAPVLRTNLESARKGFLNTFDLDTISSISDEEKENPCARETIDAFFTNDYERNINMLGAYAYGVIYDDEQVANKAKRFAVFFSKVILRSRDIAIEDDVQDKPYSVWHSSQWDVNVQVLFGGTCFALLYDIVYNDISEEERIIMRSAIAAAVFERRSWGVGFPTRRIQSNWACYHGDLYTLASVVDGEEGAENDVCTPFADLVTHYLEYAIYDSGHPMEDAYALNLALREGSLCFLAMARRGHNVFNHPRKYLFAETSTIFAFNSHIVSLCPPSFIFPLTTSDEYWSHLLSD